MAYDPITSSFNGIVQNTTSQRLCKVGVEVHLSNGTELGPTPPIDLAPGQTRNVRLSAAGETFDRWGAHPETSACSGGSGSVGSGENSGGSGKGEGSHQEGSD